MCMCWQGSAERCLNGAQGSEIVAQSAAAAEHDPTTLCRIHAQLSTPLASTYIVIQFVPTPCSWSAMKAGVTANTPLTARSTNQGARLRRWKI